MSFHNFLIKKSYIDMDYLYGKLSKAQGLSEDTGKDKKAMEHFYEKGFQDGEKIGTFCYCKN